jgi:hypothetical protein
MNGQLDVQDGESGALGSGCRGGVDYRVDLSRSMVDFGGYLTDRWDLWSANARSPMRRGRRAPCNRRFEEVRMVRPMSFLLSTWLSILFVAGHNMPVPQWIVWCDGVAVLLSFLLGCIAPLLSNRARVILSGLLSLGLFAIWLGAEVTHARYWLHWATLYGLIWYVGVIVAEQLWSPRTLGTMRPPDSMLATDA